MRSKISLIQALFILGIGGIAFSSVFFALSRPSQSSYTKPLSHAASQAFQYLVEGKTVTRINVGAQTSVGLPIRLKISKLHVDAAITSVGLTFDGAMDITKNPEDVAWFEPGQRPGETGTAVLAGHYGKWKNGTEGVFNNLSTLQQGDIINVEDQQGAIISFIVREGRSYDPKADTSEVFSSNDDKAHLNLITCEGVWDSKSKSYSKRLVVFADKE